MCIGERSLSQDQPLTYWIHICLDMVPTGLKAEIVYSNVNVLTAIQDINKTLKDTRVEYHSFYENV
jgi:hypothetical protein